ncbi:hypothetical protein [Micromonospora rubida]|uniref:hypothetical protein n=1 Tax=Micromonospora rubida TaxID=2697657 RepID=UPI0013765945|nr:hypothetical protein [Micromonospora rubida]NBE81807.1 hypothetical protein [Micromonospora rubida]
MTGAPTVACPDCDGVTFRLDPCRCTRYGDRLLADDGPPGDAEPRREPYRKCELCRGVGTVAVACPGCGRRGRRRAQLVLTVANLDTGAVASHLVAPGTLDPRPDPAGDWVADLTSRVRELAAATGVAATVDPLTVRLPPAWRPDLPADERHELEGRAVAEAARPAWRVLVGRSTAPPPLDLAARLAQLCALADLLLLDLVVEARRHGDAVRWNVRYEVPGSPVPAAPTEPRADLSAALARTEVADALAGLGERGPAAPARMLRPDLPRPLAAPAVDVDEVERRIRADCAGLTDGEEPPGAQAVWRDGHWWHTGLGPSQPVETLVEQPTGQVVRRVRVPLRRLAEPPDPPWLGEPVPWRPCPDCRPGEPLRACRCRAGGRPADDGCTACGGLGLRPSALACATCGGTRRLHRAALVTLTDLRHRVVHLTWQAGAPEAATPAGNGPGGRPVVRLPGRYRLGAWATVFGVRPEDLAEADGGHEIPPDVRDGYVTLPWAGADPVGELVAAVGPALPAARLLVIAVRPDAPPLAELLRLALGLDLALVVSALDLRGHPADPMRAHGLLWSVDLRSPADPVRPDDLPCRPSLEAAVAHCLECLDVALTETVPADPEKSIPVPQSTPRALPSDPLPGLLRLAARHAGRTVTVRFAWSGCTVHCHDEDGPLHLAEGSDLGFCG